MVSIQILVAIVVGILTIISLIAGFVVKAIKPHKNLSSRVSKVEKRISKLETSSKKHDAINIVLLKCMKELVKTNEPLTKEIDNLLISHIGDSDDDNSDDP